MSTPLRRVIDDLAEPVKFGMVMRPPTWTDEERTEAAAVLPVFEARYGGATERAHVDTWISELLGARLGRPPQDDAALDAFIDLVALTYEDLPAGAWGAEALRAGLRAWKWWPTVAEVGEVLTPIATRLRNELAALRQIAAPAAAPVLALAAPEEKPATAAYVSAVLQQLAIGPGRPRKEDRRERVVVAPPPERPAGRLGDPRAAPSVAGSRAGIRRRYEEMAASPDPEMAAEGRAGLAAMDRAAARQAAEADPRA